MELFSWNLNYFVQVLFAYYISRGEKGGRVCNLLTIDDEGEEDRKLYNKGYKIGIMGTKKGGKEGQFKFNFMHQARPCDMQIEH